MTGLFLLVSYVAAIAACALLLKSSGSAVIAIAMTTILFAFFAGCAK